MKPPSDEAVTALRLIVEDLIDDLVESGNGLRLDQEWVDEMLGQLIMARDKPNQFLREHARIPGSDLDRTHPRSTP